MLRQQGLCPAYAHITRADFILHSHSHFNHTLDMPYIARKTGAVVIGTESTTNLARAGGVPESQLLSVRGGEDYAFSGFSVRVIPSLHSALNGKHFFDSRVVPRDFRGPRRLGSDVEGGTLAYLLRLGGYEILWFGSMNFIEREVAGLRPEVAMIAAARQRLEIHDYTARLMRALGSSPARVRHALGRAVVPLWRAAGRAATGSGGLRERGQSGVAANPRDPSTALRAPHSAADAPKCIRIETLTCRRNAGSMAAMGVYDQIKKAFQDIIAPELHTIRGDIRLLDQKLHGLDQKIDGVNNSLGAKIDGVDARLNLKLDGMKGELLAEIRGLDTRIDGVDVRIDGIDRNLQTAIEIRERLAALEARRPS